MTRALSACLVVLSGCAAPSMMDAAVVEVCADLGGTCQAVSACGVGMGYLGPSRDCGGGTPVCCLPLSACASAVEFECCSNSATYRPTCEAGQLRCASGTQRCGLDAGSGVACTRGGGTCRAQAACGRDAGYVASTQDCPGGAANICCLPLTACTMRPEPACCTATTQVRPTCITGGFFLCPAGTDECEWDAGAPPRPDAGPPDAGPPDAGPPDAGPDAGPPDAGPPDGGPRDGGS